jgi:hypothetical protein
MAIFKNKEVKRLEQEVKRLEQIVEYQELLLDVAANEQADEQTASKIRLHLGMDLTLAHIVALLVPEFEVPESESVVPLDYVHHQTHKWVDENVPRTSSGVLSMAVWAIVLGIPIGEVQAKFKAEEALAASEDDLAQ